MDELEKENILFDELGLLLSRFTSEYDLSYAQILGVLKLIEYDIIEQLETLRGDSDET